MDTNNSSAVVSCEVCESTDTNTNVVLQKRGRGRPRKNPITTMAAPTDVVKRGRGRPRKNAVAV